MAWFYFKLFFCNLICIFLLLDLFLYGIRKSSQVINGFSCWRESLILTWSFNRLVCVIITVIGQTIHSMNLWACSIRVETLIIKIFSIIRVSIYALCYRSLIYLTLFQVILKIILVRDRLLRWSWRWIVFYIRGFWLKWLRLWLGLFLFLVIARSKILLVFTWGSNGSLIYAGISVWILFVLRTNSFLGVVVRKPVWLLIGSRILNWIFSICSSSTQWTWWLTLIYIMSRAVNSISLRELLLPTWSSLIKVILVAFIISWLSLAWVLSFFPT